MRLHPDRTLRLEDEPVPRPAAGEVRLLGAAISLYSSARHWILQGGMVDMVLPAPLDLGHEFCGVPETGRFAGRLVAVDPAIHCGRCEPCRTGAPNLCLDVRFAGHGNTSGALRECICWPEDSLFPLSDTLDAVQGAL